MNESINLTFIYGIVLVMAFALMIGYNILIKEKEKWISLLFISVFVVNLGYFCIAIADTLQGALMANRIAYLGSCFLPLCMLMAIRKMCGFEDKKWFKRTMVTISIVAFVIAASQGITNWYYEEVSIIYIDGMAKLSKVYGPLHMAYTVYLLMHLVMMIITVSVTLAKKQNIASKSSAMLITVAFLNMAIWAVEQIGDFQFEFLSISYIISEMLLLFLYSAMADYEKLQNSLVRQENAKKVAIDRFLINNPRVMKLTSKEKDILVAMLHDKKRKEIAEEFEVTENTIKKHTTHIFQKLEVKSREELKENLSVYVE